MINDHFDELLDRLDRLYENIQLETLCNIDLLDTEDMDYWEDIEEMEFLEEAESDTGNLLDYTLDDLPFSHLC